MGFLDFFSTPDQSDLLDPKKNPVGVASQKTSKLTEKLGGALKGGREEGFGAAEDILARRGKTASKAGERARSRAADAAIMRKQDITQQAAQAGLHGTKGAETIGRLSEAAGARAQQEAIAQDVLGERERETADIGSILQGLFQQSGLDLAAGAIPAQEDTRPTGFKNLLGAAGASMGAYSNLMGAGGLFNKGGG